MKGSFQLIVIILLLFTTEVIGQTQTIKGKVLDAQSNYPLIGANIILLGTDPLRGSTTDVDGNFKIENVPVGRQTLAIHYVGYKRISVPNVLVTAGKQVILSLFLEESVEKLDEVIVTAASNKDLPINDLAKVSARTFSLEEVMRFAGGRGDVARLASTFAGVSAPNDSRNDIVVRGNAPTGLLWRIEGIPIATTNHFATLGTTGGPVSLLNTNLLRTSDFLTGAFPAEYGNANAAVFDVNFRNGNTEEFEFTGQLGAFTGLEFMAEGPISKKNNSSFLASYRYGIASVAAPGTNAAPFYQDISFKVNFGKSKLGRFELFGLGGKSSIEFIGDEIDETDLFANPNENAAVRNELGLIGLSNLLQINKTTYLRTAIGASTNFNEYLQDNIVRNAEGNFVDSYRAINAINRENRFTFSSTFNKKFNAKWSLRAGYLGERYVGDYNTEGRDNRSEIPDVNNDNIPDYLITITDFKGNYTLSQLFAQSEYKLNDNVSITAGVHSQYLDFTEASSIEPRVAVSWQASAKDKLSLAYGKHVQSPPAPLLFFQEETSPGVTELSNQDLDFIKSDHFVLAYDRSIGPNWRLKAEAYYQSLYNVPVESIASSYSMLNEGADFVFEEKGGLQNTGTGSNVGMEITLEKFFSKGYYLLMTTSVFDSKYKGSDGIERSTAFNNQLVYNMLFGKEWKIGLGGRNAFTFDTKFTTSGGKPFTPIDLDATRNNAGREVHMDDIAFSENYDNYLRWDVKFGIRINSKKGKRSHQFFFDLQNVMGIENEFVRRYNEVTDEINSVSQIGFFPDVLYRFQF